MMTRPGENWRFVALLSRRRLADGGWGNRGMGGVCWTGLDLDLSLCSFFFFNRCNQKDSSNWADQVGR